MCIFNLGLFHNITPRTSLIQLCMVHQNPFAWHMTERNYMNLGYVFKYFISGPGLSHLEPLSPVVLRTRVIYSNVAKYIQQHIATYD